MKQSYKEHNLFNIDQEPCDFDNGKYKWWLVRAPRQTKDKKYRSDIVYALWYVSNDISNKYLITKNDEPLRDFDGLENAAVFMDVLEYTK